MKHVRAISQAPSPAQSNFAGLETGIILILSIIFQDYDNFPQVIQNLQKAFSKI